MTLQRQLDELEASKWHLDKKVPLSLIFAMLAQVIIVVWSVADIKKDVEVLKAAQIIQRERDNRQDAAIIAAVIDVRDNIKEVKSMITRYMDRQLAAQDRVRR